MCVRIPVHLLNFFSHQVRAVHASSVVALEALCTLQMLLREGVPVLRQFLEIVQDPQCVFFNDLADMMAHSIFLLEQVR
jgi:hypothetical protein